MTNHTNSTSSSIDGSTRPTVAVGSTEPDRETVNVGRGPPDITRLKMSAGQDPKTRNSAGKVPQSTRIALQAMAHDTSTDCSERGHDERIDLNIFNP